MVFLGNMASPIGIIRIAATGNGICLLSFTHDKKGFFKELEKLLGEVASVGEENEIIAAAKKQLADYFEGRLTDFTVPLELLGTDFQKKVWGELLKIPYGELRSYGDIADSLGDRRYSRAVGTANKKNPVPILVPCHRVIRKGRRISNYSGGLEVQQALFRVEGIKYGDIRYIK